MRKSKVLLFDLETAPMNAYLWRPGQEWVPHEMLQDDTFLLSWSAKWFEHNKVYSSVVTPDEAVARNDVRIVAELADLMREAEMVMAHNARRFDVPKMNGRLMLLRQEPLTPMRVLDTLVMARQSFDLPYNKLDYLAEILFNDHKIKTDFELWRLCVRGDEKALARMVRYNRKDVRLLERVFLEMRPYVKGLPRMAIPERDREWACPTCTSGNVVKRGFHDTNVSRFQTWYCKDCKRYSRTYQGTIEPRAGLIPLP